MSTIRGTIRDGKVVLDEPANWPEGTRVSVGPMPIAMMTEDEQGDDPESIARWLAAFDAIPVVVESPLDDPAAVAWRDTMERHNHEAVRRQMQERPE